MAESDAGPARCLAVAGGGLAAPLPVALTPLPWYWARLVAPVLATLLALAYLAQRPPGLPSDMALRTAEATSEARSPFARASHDPDHRRDDRGGHLAHAPGSVHPGLKTRRLVSRTRPRISDQLIWSDAPCSWRGALPIALFGLSWGLRDLFLAAASPLAESLMLSFAGGEALGLVFGPSLSDCGVGRWVSHRHGAAVSPRLSGARLPRLARIGRRRRCHASLQGWCRASFPERRPCGPPRCRQGRDPGCRW